MSSSDFGLIGRFMVPGPSKWRIWTTLEEWIFLAGRSQKWIFCNFGFGTLRKHKSTSLSEIIGHLGRKWLRKGLASSFQRPNFQFIPDAISRLPLYLGSWNFGLKHYFKLPISWNIQLTHKLVMTLRTDLRSLFQGHINFEFLKMAPWLRFCIKWTNFY